MIFLAGFAPFQPTPGLALWSLIIFLLFWMLMSKYAFKPMMEGLKKRETDISDALAEAEKAREEMANLKAENEQILAEAREERALMLKEAKETKANIIAEAKEKAKEDALRITSSAKMEIENEKKAALTEVKNEVGMMATEIAEKILRKELKGQPEHESFVNTLVGEFKLN
jgi:F-type H+-transporting ATPase subunit b